jgi:coenzyme F420 hydrogenase subunit beta
MSRVDSIQDVVRRNLCMGCGACAAARPDVVRMHDTVAHGRRPVIAADAAPQTGRELAKICPGRAIDAAPPAPGGARDYSHAAWGPVLEVWEGHATDPELRFRGSSGGVISALALFCIEMKDYAGAVQVRARPDQPLLNESVISRSRADVLAASASRYAPASPCERLADVRESGQPHLFIGKPCDVAGSARLAAEQPALADSVALSISIFCAGTPSIAGSRELLRRLGVADDDEVLELRYRGRGWPGNMVARFRKAGTGEIREASTSYAEGWGEILQKHKQWRCQLCADHLGEHADLSIGDPWYRPIADDEAGQSLIVVRTERGRRILQEAMRSGVLSLERRSLETLAASQPNLEQTRGAVFGRCQTARIAGASAPRYRGAGLHRVWWRALSPIAKFRSVAGTAKRLLRKGLLLDERARPIGAEQP